MKHGNVLKKLNFDILTPLPRVEVGCHRPKYLLPCIRESLKFDMQHDHVLKKLHFYILTPLPKYTQGSDTVLWSKLRLICFFIIVLLSACEISVKNIDLTTDWVIAKFKCLTLPKGSGWWSKILSTVLLIYRHWIIMAYSEKFSDTIVLEHCEVYTTKKPI